MKWTKTSKDYFEEIMLAIAIAALACLIYLSYYNTCTGCTYTNKQGVVITGDCEELRHISDMENQKEVIDGSERIYGIDWKNINITADGDVG